MKQKTTQKKVIVLKSERDIPLKKSELNNVKHVLMEYIKKEMSRFRKNGCFTLDKSDSMQLYRYRIFSDVVRAYNKMNNKHENDVIYQHKLMEIEEFEQIEAIFSH